MLKKGDTIGIIALSGECDFDRVKNAKTFIEGLGYNVILSKNIFDKKRYLAGDDETKVQELENFFENTDIKLILCARGGYGSIRLINRINYDILRKNPKPFCGFSDVTALLLMIYKKTGIYTYHSPMACTDFFDENIETVQNFFELVNTQEFEYYGKKVYKDGISKGIIWGGNLSTIVSLCGQDFIPNKDFIFFAEDLNEPVYKIDKMFQQLINIPKFTKHCKGIVLGDFLDVDNNIWLEEYFEELSLKLNVPFAGGFPITHSQHKITLPIGQKAILDGIKLIKG